MSTQISPKNMKRANALVEQLQDKLKIVKKGPNVDTHISEGAKLAAVTALRGLFEGECMFEKPIYDRLLKLRKTYRENFDRVEDWYISELENILKMGELESATDVEMLSFIGELTCEKELFPRLSKLYSKIIIQNIS